MSKYTLDFNDFMNEGNKPKTGPSKILEDADKRLLDTLAEIEKLELESETEPKEVSTVTPLKEKKKGIWDNIRAKKARGEKPAKKGSEAYKKAKKAMKDLEEKEVEEEFIYETPVEKIKESAIKYESPLPEPLQEAFDGYKLFNDKSELFECNIQLEGAQIANSEARLVIESEEWNLVFKGNISSNGQCSIPIKKLSILPEGTRGKIKLEVIAEDTRFIPWEDRFLVKADKKVYVQIKEQKENNLFDKPSINVSGIGQRH
tara:strand:+ start:22742 stop:23521 length:780 start_codon:yes stop_codon:yes gene_type:complete